MRIVFAGTPAFGVPILEALADRHSVVGVLTAPARPAGRGRQPRVAPVAQAAMERGLPLFTPSRLRDEEFLASMADLRADLLVTAAYGRILPSALLALWPDRAVNVHPSLLPRFRGASPIPYALLAGDADTGVTLLHMVREVDAGPIIRQSPPLPILPEENAGTLGERLSAVAADLLIRLLEEVGEGPLPAIRQPEAGVTYAPLLLRPDESLDFAQEARAVWGRVRGLAPEPGAGGLLLGREVKILAADWWLESSEGEPGTVLGFDGEALAVACGQGTLRILQIRPAGGRVQSARDFWNGPGRRAMGERILPLPV